MYRLHCFSQSGNCFKVAFMLRALQVPFETQFVDYLGGATRSPEWREGLNEMGEVPVLEDGARRLTQSGAILSYLAAKHGAFGGADEAQRYDILRWLMFDNHKFTSYLGTYRFLRSFGATPPDPAVLAFLKSRSDTAYEIVDKHLADREWLVGAAPTIADFSLSGYLFFPAEETGYDLPARFPRIAAWVERLREVPGWADPYEVLPGERIAPKWAATG
jgi:glutathione S-transferase